MNPSYYVDKLRKKLEEQEIAKKLLDEEKQKKCAALKELRTSLWDTLYIYLMPFQTLVLSSKDPIVLVGSLNDFRITVSRLFTIMLKIKDTEDKVSIVFQPFGGGSPITFNDVGDTMEYVVEFLLDKVRIAAKVPVN